ncbi:MAG: hypothetical protein DI563_19370 [Variovorax paradoxus]|uniref:Phage-related protein n=1 Tax=Variovorax paradoxus TaxID=34073 RepID=A0A2W5PUJ0_VARPD|nr:MAG: hypothetical protein DI563_19370 [Variovorax paradoxus]
MVRALLAGTKTQTRRVITNQPHSVTLVESGNHLFDYRNDLGDYSRVVPMSKAVTLCPYGQPGDRLWVRETFTDSGRVLPPIEEPFIYAADRNEAGVMKWAARWKPSIHMPRAASRILLEVTGVRVERLQDISEADAREEGATFHDGCGVGHSGWRHDHGDVHADARSAYARLWEQINGAGSWDANPWVWVAEFARATTVPNEAKP